MPGPRLYAGQIGTSARFPTLPPEVDRRYTALMSPVRSNPVARYALFVIVVPFGLLWLVSESPFRMPILLVVLGVPLLLGVVPRNRIYGMRSCYALSSDERWYRQNVITGVAMLAVGAIWMLVELLP